MTVSLPSIISEYMTAADGGAVGAIVACFTEDGVVRDEDQEWRGRAAIRQWRESVATAYQYTVEVRGAAPILEVDGEQGHEVNVRLEGNFPGGIVDLVYRFGLRDGRIARLEIHP